VTECYQNSFDFPSVSRRRVELDFSGGEISSDAGVLLLRKTDERIGLSKAIARALPDHRRRRSCQHSVHAMISQRLYAIGLGYEDLNDHDRLRHDGVLQTAVGRLESLASPSTLCRLEQRMDREIAWRLHDVLFEQFIAAHDAAPNRLILDFDATDDRVHGDQLGRYFHGYYDHYCFLPLYVFAGRHLLVSYLRTSSGDGAKHTWAILSLLVKRLRQHWPRTQIIFRGDSGFCRHRMFNWCERHHVGYVVGIARNKRLERMAEPHLEQAEEQYRLHQRKQRPFIELMYGATSWKVKRRIILKAEVTSKGRNPRFIVTNLPQSGRYLYDKLYCARGEMENRIKEQQLGLFADRTSCHEWWPNQFRLLLSGLAYTLIEAMRRIALTGTVLETAYVDTIRLKLLKIGAVIVRNTRRIRIMLSSAYPHKSLFTAVSLALNSG
jgi:hypothetical protein